jgi:hypothetical protein
MITPFFLLGLCKDAMAFTGPATASTNARTSFVSRSNFMPYSRSMTNTLRAAATEGKMNLKNLKCFYFISSIVVFLLIYKIDTS